MPGLKNAVLGFLGSSLMSKAEVVDVEVVSEHFRLITLSAAKFKSATMLPAAKIRLNAGDWEMRAYTPLSIDTAAGHIRILAYLHGQGPGANWALSTTAGTFTHIIGPQRSLDLIGLSQPAVFFGDETSIAAAVTFQSHLTPKHAARFIFEISSMSGASAIAGRLGLRNAEFHDRQADDGQLSQVTDAIQATLGEMATSHLVLTGNARSIQAIRSRLRNRTSQPIHYHVRAYWAPGKTGLE